MGFNVVRAVRVAAGMARRGLPQVRRILPGQNPNAGSAKVAVYAHFDRRGQIHDYVLYQLRELADCGFRTVFVSSSPELNPVGLDAVLALTQAVIWRKNNGHDFGSYKDGLAHLGTLAGQAQLVLMNDSVYGPIWPLARLLERFEPQTCDFFSSTDSWQHGYHLQSYFLSFYPKAFTSTAFVRFWRRLAYVNDRKWIIRACEIKLTQTLVRASLRPASQCDYWAVHRRMYECAVESEGTAEPVAGGQGFDPAAVSRYAARRLDAEIVQGLKLNPTHYCWELLLREFRAPFVKRDLLRDNPMGLPYVWLWPDVITALSDYPVELIASHLKERP